MDQNGVVLPEDWRAAESLVMQREVQWVLALYFGRENKWERAAANVPKRGMHFLTEQSNRK